MNLATMFASGPTLKAKRKPPEHVYPITILKDWQETYRAIGVSERTAQEIIVKMNRVRDKSLPKLRVSSLLRRLRSMEAKGFVEQRKCHIETSTKPVMFWKRVKKPCQ